MLRILVRLSLAFVLLSTLVACGSTSATSATSQSFAVAAKEFSFAPAQLTVTAGQPVEINFQNTGAVEHDWSVREIDLAGNPIATEQSGGGHMMGDMHDAPKLHVAAGPAGQGKLTFTPDKARSRALGGSGIGLTISRAIVEAHDGRIWAASAGLGQGATFSFRLPIAQPSSL